MYFDSKSEEPVRVLVVEDKERTRRRIEELLGACPDLEVVADAQDGSEAVCLASSYRPAIVLMDLQVPGLGGALAIRMIKRRWPEMAVLAVTSTGDLEANARAAGADAFLPGIESAESIVNSIRDLAAQSPTETQEGLEPCKS